MDSIPDYIRRRPSINQLKRPYIDLRYLDDVSTVKSRGKHWLLSWVLHTPVKNQRDLQEFLRRLELYQQAEKEGFIRNVGKPRTRLSALDRLLNLFAGRQELYSGSGS